MLDYRPAEKTVNRRSDFLSVRLQRKMAGVVEEDLGIGDVAPESLCAARQEERIVFAPYGEQRRPLLPKIFLKLRVQRDIIGVVEKEIELDVLVARTSSSAASSV